MDGGLWHCTGGSDQGEKKKCKRAKWLLEEALQIVEKRREAKGKGEKERYTHLNAELQRRARRDEKAFLSSQCKEREENHRIGKTRDLFKKIQESKGSFYTKVGTINGMDLTEAGNEEGSGNPLQYFSWRIPWTEEPGGLQSMGSQRVRHDWATTLPPPTEAEDVKKRWQEYTEELYKKDLHDPDNHDGVITHLEPDILECQVKWALGSITTNKSRGGDRIPVELFQVLNHDAGENACNMLANLESSAVATGLERVSFHSNPKERRCQRLLKLPHNCTHLTH